MQHEPIPRKDFFNNGFLPDLSRTFVLTNVPQILTADTATDPSTAFLNPAAANKGVEK